jgi:hypothetical protein
MVKSVIVELQSNRDITMSLSNDRTVPQISGVRFDSDFPLTLIPSTSRSEKGESMPNVAFIEHAVEPEDFTYILRAEIDDEKIDEIMANDNVIGVFSDPVIVPLVTCDGSHSIGTDADVERLLSTTEMHSIDMDGSGVFVAIVDTGINMEYLNSRGKNPNFDATRSWAPQNNLGSQLGKFKVDHGTMCAYDVCIAAPKCTLLDIALLQPRKCEDELSCFHGLLSDAILAYRHLINIMRDSNERRSLVVNNSWGMFRASEDYPVGDPGNYSHNPNHPFNRIVGELERSGADIIFAAGNCGSDCPDPRCDGVTDNTIRGANSHPSVLCVAGIDINKIRVGYSSVGPGCLTQNKPDISGYTNFRGSDVYKADSGTSAAAPVVTGVVAAVRSKQPYDPNNSATYSSAIRSLITSTAEDLGSGGYDFFYGYGVVNGDQLQQHFAQPLSANENWFAENVHETLEQQQQVQLH